MEGREIREAAAKLGAIGERLVAAVEKLNETPVLEVEAGPAVCPHCNTMNPVVTVEDTEGEGKMEDIILEFGCMACGHSFLGVPNGWMIFHHRQELLDAIQARNGGVENG